MATHSSVLAWRIPGTGEPGGCRLWGHTESDTTEVTQQQVHVKGDFSLSWSYMSIATLHFVRRFSHALGLLINIVSLHIEFWGFPGGSAGKESACNAGDLDSIPGLGRSPGKGNIYLLQYSGLENSMDCIVHKVTKSWT